MKKSKLAEQLESIFMDKQDEDIDRRSTFQSIAANKEIDSHKLVNHTIRATDLANMNYMLYDDTKPLGLESLSCDIIFSMYEPEIKSNPLKMKFNYIANKTWYWLNRPIPGKIKKWMKNSWIGKKIKTRSQKRLKKLLNAKKLKAIKYLTSQGVTYPSLIQELFAQKHAPVYKEAGVLPKGGFTEQSLDSIICDLNNQGDDTVPFYRRKEYKDFKNMKQQERIRDNKFVVYAEEVVARKNDNDDPSIY